VTFAYLTGWRVPSEVLRLTWDRVDFGAGVVRLDVRTTKNGAGRTFPFDVLPELAAVPAAPAALHGGVRGGHLPGRIPHDFRRMAARNLLRAGVPESWAMQLTGRKTPAIFRRYAITNEAHLREAVTKLAGSLEAISRTKPGQFSG
jgi:integrase